MFIVALGVVAPIFALVALGFLAAKTRLVSEKADAGLSEFVFMLALPALLFRTVATADFPPFNPGAFWISYFLALAICWAIASFAARSLGRSQKEAAIIGFASAQSNTVLVGIPLVLRAFGEAGSVPLVLLLVVHLPITMSIVTVLIARGEAEGNVGRKLVMGLITHPILVAIGIGALWRLADIPLADPVRQILRFLGDAAAPCALVAMGLSMNRVRFQGSHALIALVAALKLLLHPFLVYLLATYLFRLPPLYTNVAVILAACPSGINAYLIAERYKSGQAVTAGAIALTTLLAAISMTLILALILAPR